MEYGDLSHTEVIISHEAKLSGVYKTKVRDKFHSHGWLLDEHFILLQEHTFLYEKVRSSVSAESFLILLLFSVVMRTIAN